MIQVKFNSFQLEREKEKVQCYSKTVMLFILPPGLILRGLFLCFAAVSVAWIKSSLPFQISSTKTALLCGVQPFAPQLLLLTCEIVKYHLCNIY